MVRRLAFRFDIDTHKCIRDGVPKLLDISRQYDVPFTFFLNAGKAVSILDSLKKLYSKKSSSIEQYEMMSAMQKLGKIDYMIAAFTNPKISDYKSQIKRLLISGCEVGLHGGKNHSLWGVIAPVGLLRK